MVPPPQLIPPGSWTHKCSKSGPPRITPRVVSRATGVRSGQGPQPWHRQYPSRVLWGLGLSFTRFAIRVHLIVVHNGPFGRSACADREKACHERVFSRSYPLNHGKDSTTASTTSVGDPDASAAPCGVLRHLHATSPRDVQGLPQLPQLVGGAQCARRGPVAPVARCTKRSSLSLSLSERNSKLAFLSLSLQEEEEYGADFKRLAMWVACAGSARHASACFGWVACMSLSLRWHMENLRQTQPN